MSKSRGTFRQELATRLDASITSAAIVANHQTTDFTQSPLVRVMSAGSKRPAVEASGDRLQFRYIIQIWVLSEVNPGYTEEDSDDMLDAVEAEIAQWLEDNNHVSGWWSGIKYDEFSMVNKVKIGGEMWLVEDVAIIVEVYT